MCVKIIASQRWDVFWDTVYIVKKVHAAKRLRITDVKIMVVVLMMTTQYYSLTLPLS